MKATAKTKTIILLISAATISLNISTVLAEKAMTSTVSCENKDYNSINPFNGGNRIPIIKYQEGEIFNIFYNANGGSGAFVSPDIRYSEKTNVISNVDAEITRAHYTFEQWNSSFDGTGMVYSTGDEITLTSDVTLYAQWQAIFYIVSFECHNGANIASQSLITGQRIAKPANPIKEDYTFAGWFTDDGVFANKWSFDTDTINQDWTLYAKWTKKPKAAPPADPSETDHMVLWIAIGAIVLITFSAFVFIIAKKKMAKDHRISKE